MPGAARVRSRGRAIAMCRGVRKFVAMRQIQQLVRRGVHFVRFRIATSAGRGGRRLPLTPPDG